MVLVLSSFEEGDGDGTANRADLFRGLEGEGAGAVDRGGRVYEGQSCSRSAFLTFTRRLPADG